MTLSAEHYPHALHVFQPNPDTGLIISEEQETSQDVIWLLCAPTLVPILLAFQVGSNFLLLTEDMIALNVAGLLAKS